VRILIHADELTWKCGGRRGRIGATLFLRPIWACMDGRFRGVCGDVCRPKRANVGEKYRLRSGLRSGSAQDDGALSIPVERGSWELRLGRPPLRLRFSGTSRLSPGLGSTREDGAPSILVERASLELGAGRPPARPDIPYSVDSIVRVAAPS
jgi:hypothetical protein